MNQEQHLWITLFALVGLIIILIIARAYFGGPTLFWLGPVLITLVSLLIVGYVIGYLLHKKQG